MSDCDVARMDEYMDNGWEPDHIHERLLARAEKAETRVKELEQCVNFWKAQPQLMQKTNLEIVDALDKAHAKNKELEKRIKSRDKAIATALEAITFKDKNETL